MLQDNTLQYSIYIHLVRCTDIRPAHLSLFFRNNCLSVHVKACVLMSLVYMRWRTDMLVEDNLG